jgi:hypothetical protein
MDSRNRLPFYTRIHDATCAIFGCGWNLGPKLWRTMHDGVYDNTQGLQGMPTVTTLVVARLSHLWLWMEFGAETRYVDA